MGNRGKLRWQPLSRKKKDTRAWRAGEKAALRNLPSETDEDGQQRLAQVAIVKEKQHTRAWRPGEKATLRNPTSETEEHGQQRLAQVAIVKQKQHTRAWRPGEKATRRNPTSETEEEDRKSTRLNSSHANISYAVFCLKKKKK